MKLDRHKLLRWYAVALTGVIAIFLLSSTSKKTPETNSNLMPHLDDASLPQIIKGIDLEKRYEFAGELIPVDNFDVKERLERELSVNSYWHSSTLLNIKTTHRYFPTIERILKENDVPDDFKYLAVAESNLRNETSPAGAKGFWQFMKATGKYYGLEITSEVDERFNLELATQAFCDYIKDYYQRFGSWSLAATAYNVGGTRLSRSLREQKATNFYDLNLNAETNRYLFRIIAMKEIISDPGAFGFYIPEKERYQPLSDYKIVEINGSITSLGEFAATEGVSYRMLKVYNPWLISHHLNNPSQKTYQIKVPL